jgi:hypothetical protein
MLWTIETFEINLDATHHVVAITISFFFYNIQYSIKYRMKNVFPLPRIPDIKHVHKQ